MDGLGNYNTYSAPGYPGFHGFALRFVRSPDWALADLVGLDDRAWPA